MRHNALEQLFAKAISARADVHQVTDGDGWWGQIERFENYPSAARVTFQGAGEEPSFPTWWNLPATNARPRFYPEDAPYVPGMSCRILEGPKRIYATWPHDFTPDVAANIHISPPRLEAIAPELDVAWGHLKMELAQGKLSETSLGNLVERLADTPAQEFAAVRSAVGPPASECAEAFESIVEQCLASGWQAVDVESPSVLIPMAVFERTDSRRVLSLMGGGDASRLVLAQDPCE